jgi:hypothetical protein
MQIKAPYRLHNIKHIKEFEKYVPKDYFPDSMLSFVSTHRLIIPPLLKKISDRLDVTIKTVEESHASLVNQIPQFLEDENPFQLFEILRKEFLDVTDDLPVSYDDCAVQACIKGLSLLNKIKPRSAVKLKEAFDRLKGKSEISGKLERRTLMINLIGEVFQVFLSTSNEAMNLFLKHTIIALLSYNTHTWAFEEEIWERIEEYDTPCIELIKEFWDLYCRKLMVLKELFLQPSVITFIQHFKDKIIKQQIPANLRRNIIDQMNMLFRDAPVSKVKNNINKIIGLYENVAGENELQRAKGILQNFLFLLKKYEDFFENNFYCSQIKVFYSPAHAYMKKKLNRETIARDKKLTFYPCKDYHDYLKGYYSHDCTVEEDLAGDHLSNPRFFNIRIFYSDEWVGNIYMLDYSEDKGIILIDRIQIKKSFTFMPIRFFSTFMKKLADLLVPTNSQMMIIAPHNISNFPHIMNSFKRYAEHCEKITFCCDETEEAFESYDEEVFYVLHPPAE